MNLTDEDLALARETHEPGDWEDIPELADIKKLVNGLGYEIVPFEEYEALKAKKGAFDEIH